MTNKKTSSASKHIFIAGFTFVGGLALGVLAVITLQNSNPQDDIVTRDVALGDVQQTSPKHSDSTTSGANIGIEQFQEIFKRQSISEQYAVLHTTLSGASERELKNWWIHSQEIERENHRKIAQRVILQSLTTINPVEALRSIEDVSKFHVDPLLESVFNQWSISQLDDAIEAATTLSGSRRNVALKTILETRDDLSASERLSIAKQLGGEEALLKLVSDNEASQRLAEPLESWKILLNDEVDDYLQEDSLAIVAEAWREQDGFEVLSHIYDSRIENYQMKNRLLREVANVDLPGAFRFSQRLVEEGEKLHLARLIVREWAKDDALATLTAISTFEPSSMASQLEDYISITWARAKPREAIENIGWLSEEFRLFALESAFSEIARENPADAIARVSSVASFVVNTSSILERIIHEWARKKPADATEWVVQNFAQEDPQRRMLVEEVLPYLTREDPTRAFELALQHPDPDKRWGLDYVVINEIAGLGNIELAKELLPRVQEKSKARSYNAVGAAMVRASQTDEALEFGKDLDETSQVSYYYRVILDWSRGNPKNLFESLEDLPTDDLKSLAATQLIQRNQRQPVLTDDQIEHAKTFVSSDE